MTTQSDPGAVNGAVQWGGGRPTAFPRHRYFSLFHLTSNSAEAQPAVGRPASWSGMPVAGGRADGHRNFWSPAISPGTD